MVTSGDCYFLKSVPQLARAAGAIAVVSAGLGSQQPHCARVGAGSAPFLPEHSQGTLSVICSAPGTFSRCSALRRNTESQAELRLCSSPCPGLRVGAMVAQPCTELRLCRQELEGLSRSLIKLTYKSSWFPVACVPLAALRKCYGRTWSIPRSRRCLPSCAPIPFGSTRC